MTTQCRLAIDPDMHGALVLAYLMKCYNQDFSGSILPVMQQSETCTDLVHDITTFEKIQ